MQEYGIDSLESLTPEEAQSKWTKVYPVFVRVSTAKIRDSGSRWEEELHYIASSPEQAIAWIKRQQKLMPYKIARLRNEPGDNWYWYVIKEDAIDGEYSGIGGIYCLMSDKGEEMEYDPSLGYRREQTNEATQN